MFFSYASQFTLIHCEFYHPWSHLFKFVGFGTAEDHNVHHAYVKYNFGHFTMWYDRLFGTYVDGATKSKFTLCKQEKDLKAKDQEQENTQKSAK